MALITENGDVSARLLAESLFVSLKSISAVSLKTNPFSTFLAIFRAVVADSINRSRSISADINASSLLLCQRQVLKGNTLLEKVVNVVRLDELAWPALETVGRSTPETL